MKFKAAILFFCLAGFVLFNGYLLHPSNPTQTLMPVIIAAQMVLLLPAAFQVKNVWGKAVLILVAAPITGYLVYCQCRAAWLGLAAGVLLLAYIHGSLRNRKVNRVLLISLTVITSVLVFGFKTGSSKGRMLIYKVIAEEMPTRQWFTGIGGGRFKAVYNTWQSQYFTRYNINSREALMADNTYYAFNDYLQYTVEYGLAGLLVILSVLLFFMVLLKKIRNSRPQNPYAAGALGSITVIGVSALFSYPLQNGWVQVYVLLCFLFATIQLSFKWFKWTAAGAVAVLVVVIAEKQFKQQVYDRLNKKAVLYSQTGRKQMALQLLTNAAKNGCTDGNTLYLLAKTCYQSGKPDSALFWLKQAAGKIINLETTTLFANIYAETRQYAMAEAFYLKAVYMIPNRFESRFNLVRFYKEHHNDSLAAQWTALTRDLPVKIASEKVNRILKEINK